MLSNSNKKGEKRDERKKKGQMLGITDTYFKFLLLKTPAGSPIREIETV